MSLIEPNSKIFLIKNVPLNNAYKHTIYFSDKSAQAVYFKGKVFKEFEAQSYQRVNSGMLKLGVKADDIYNASYLMFQNTDFGNKWFYAFITSVNYVNNAVSEITYELDVIQSYYFDFTLKKCLVEREHTATDGLFEHLVPEPFNPSEYRMNQIQIAGSGEDLFSIGGYILATMCNTVNPAEGGKRASGGKFNGIFYPCDMLFFPIEEENALSLMIKGINDTLPDSILYLTTVPKIVSNNLTTTTNTRRISTTEYSTFANINIQPSHTNIDGYTPKNKKCFNYPYHYLVASNSAGGGSEYRFEDFQNNTNIEFSCYSDISENTTIQITPNNYKSVIRGLDYGFVGQTYPTQPYSTNQDAYFKQQEMNLRNQNTINIVNGAIGTSISILGGGVSALGGAEKAEKEDANLSYGGLVGSIGSTANFVSSLKSMEEAEDNMKKMHSLVAPRVSGVGGASSIAVLNQQIAPKFYTKNCQRDEIKAIDDFFTIYGYKVNKLKTPSGHGVNGSTFNRPSYNYVKTQNCVVVGEMPAIVNTKICSIFNNGLTFWKDGNDVGNYGENGV